MNKSEFINLHQAIALKASTLIKQKGHHKHTAIVGKGEDLYIIGLSGAGEEISNVLKPVCTSLGADYLFLIFEAWYGPNDNIMPSSHPSKKEVLFISAQHKVYGDKAIQYEIVRNQGKISNLVKSGSEIDALGGRLSSLLVGGNGTKSVVNIDRHPGYKSHFKLPGFTVH